jgi:hypothetical protein
MSRETESQHKECLYLALGAGFKASAILTSVSYLHSDY